jgi:Centromere DNA-binding protein complex CBF3 subunit, domain 2/Transcriptional activator of glycolytic enzymes
MNFPDLHRVSCDKIIMFLDKVVTKRGLRGSQAGRGDRIGPDGDTISQTLSAASIEAYVSALMSLWREQHATQNAPGPPGVPIPSPERSEALKIFLIDRRQREADRRRNEYVDRAVGTLSDGYTHDELVDFVRHGWEGWEGGSEPGRKRKRFTLAQPESHLRTVVDFLLAHSMLLRGESRRNAELADMFTLQLPKTEGATPCWALMLRVDRGKTNHFGKVQYGVAVRHAEPLRCVLGQLACYLFYRWNVAGESPPTFRRRQDWYRFCVLKGGDARHPMSYDTQLKGTTQAFDAIGVCSSKKTHAGRAQGAKHAELARVSEDQIRRAGRWNHDALSGCYLSHIPRDFVRSTAGFASGGQGDYFVPRAMVQPPLSLVEALWPWVDQWLGWFHGNLPSPDAAVDEEEYDDDKCDKAGQGFLRLLMQLRLVFLQDSVPLRREFPFHPLWADPIFERQDYQEFAEEVELAMAEQDDEPQDALIRRALPVLADRMTAFEQAVSQKMGALEHAVNRNTQKVDANTQKVDAALEGIQEIRALFQNVFSGQAPVGVRFGPLPRTAASPPPLAPPAPPAPAPALVSQPLPLPPPPAPASAAVPSDLVSPAFPSATAGPSVQAASTAQLPEQQIRYYTMSRTIRTVPDLWREWTRGLSGQPSVQSLEDAYGARWRPEQKERTFFCRRKVIVDHIRTRTAPGGNASSAIAHLESVRVRNDWSLTKLSTVIGSGRI